MIVDMILDRKDGIAYNATDFYAYCAADVRMFHSVTAEEVVSGMDSRSNELVQKALCEYIEMQGYNPEICEYIRSVDWVAGLGRLNTMCVQCKRRGRSCHGTTEQHWTGCTGREI